MLCLSYHLCLLFYKIGEEGRTGSAWKGGEWVRGMGQRAEGRDGLNNVYTYE
jgi:hypothetical protein